jgi:hypothetical protein
MATGTGSSIDLDDPARQQGAGNDALLTFLLFGQPGHR